jgi:hypothetical protein
MTITIHINILLSGRSTIAREERPIGRKSGGKFWVQNLRTHPLDMNIGQPSNPLGNTKLFYRLT